MPPGRAGRYPHGQGVPRLGLARRSPVLRRAVTFTRCSPGPSPGPHVLERGPGRRDPPVPRAREGCHGRGPGPTRGERRRASGGDRGAQREAIATFRIPARTSGLGSPGGRKSKGTRSDFVRPSVSGTIAAPPISRKDDPVQQVEVWRVRAPLNREELEQRLRELGYAPRRPKTAFRTSARPTDVIVLLWALDHLAPDVALDLVRSVATWAGG